MRYVRDLDVNEIAYKFCVGTQTIRNWKRAGCPHEYRKVGLKEKLYFNEKEVAKWLKEKEEEKLNGL